MPTTISIVNATPFAFDLVTAVTPYLSTEYYSTLATTAPSQASPTNVLEFDRNQGIKDGHVWTFTTQFTLDGVTVVFSEELTGTFASSDMLQQMSAGDVSTGFDNTNDPVSKSFKGASGTVYEMAWALSLSSSGYMNIQYTVSVQQPAYQPITPVMTQIETVVVLMLENRSLDNVLGWLYASGAPAVVYPPGSSPSFDGLVAGQFQNSSAGGTFSPQPGTQDDLFPCRTPSFDPGEPMPDVVKQLYADASGNLPSSNPWSLEPTMTGFAADYYASYLPDPGEVMGAYSPAQLPVLNGLARAFAVSDRWFSSAPTQTNPNRAFSICGTSLGAEVNSDISEGTYANANTIFNVLGAAGKTWGFYWQSDDPFGTGEPVTSWNPFTSYYFSRMNQAPNGTTGTYQQFLNLAAAGQLPSFCYLEPYWGGGKGDELDPKDPNGWVGIQGNDYHPPAWIGPAEADLLTLFQALRNSPQWPSMLFVITFDEHGGTYDHVPPPTTVAPDTSVGPSGFTFERLGVRVPTLLISPFVPAGTVFRAPSGGADFDHTSLLATLCKWAGVDPASAQLGARTAIAPTFEGVLVSQARDVEIAISLPSDYASQGGGVGTILGIPASARAAMSAGGPARLHVDDFRAAEASSATAKDFAEKLQALLVAGKRR